jgi:hypothetical protein
MIVQALFSSDGFFIDILVDLDFLLMQLFSKQFFFLTINLNIRRSVYIVMWVRTFNNFRPMKKAIRDDLISIALARIALAPPPPPPPTISSDLSTFIKLGVGCICIITGIVIYKQWRGR